MKCKMPFLFYLRLSEVHRACETVNDARCIASLPRANGRIEVGLTRFTLMKHWHV